MKWVIIALIIIALLGYIFYRNLKPVPADLKDQISEQELPQTEISKVFNMKIASPAFKHNEAIPSQYTCDGANVNPPLEISGTPADTKSLALIVDDPDAPASTWTHWTIWNINPDITVISENSVPAGGIEGLTSFGKSGYGGPCPPSGTHRYFFKIFALDTRLNLQTSAKASDIIDEMQGHVLAQTELIGLYKKQ